jgi:AraC-like DNA-binding protein
LATHTNWVARVAGDIDRIEACFSGAAYASHRHDTYAIGITLAGVQSFDYRGSTRHSLPGQMVILHPDELHDGRAGDGGEFRYRAAYVEPGDIQCILDGTPLPFIQSGVSDNPRLFAAVRMLLQDYDRPFTGLACKDALYDVATALQAASGPRKSIKIVNRQAAMRARDYIETHLDAGFSLVELEGATCHDRWQLSRDFRAMFGTSPYRYLILRRLDRARRMMLDGHANAEAAVACGFADQSHFIRHFRRAFGLTPTAWFNLIVHDHSISPSRFRLTRRRLKNTDRPSCFRSRL